MMTVLGDEATCGLGEIRIENPPETFTLTPASLISLQAIGKSRSLLRGAGIDWGSGSGCLAIVAAKIATVQKIFGLEISRANVYATIQNAALNGVASKVEFLLSDSYTPVSAQDHQRLLTHRGKIDFIIANPPAAPSGDGFEYRRIVRCLRAPIGCRLIWREPICSIACGYMRKWKKKAACHTPSESQAIRKGGS